MWIIIIMSNAFHIWLLHSWRLSSLREYSLGERAWFGSMMSCLRVIFFVSARIIINFLLLRCLKFFISFRPCLIS